MLRREITTESMFGECRSCRHTGSKPYRYTLPGSGDDGSVIGVVKFDEDGKVADSPPNRGSASTSRLRMEVAGRITLIGFCALAIISTIWIGGYIGACSTSHTTTYPQNKARLQIIPPILVFH